MRACTRGHFLPGSGEAELRGVASRSLLSLSSCRWATGVPAPPAAAQTHAEWAYETHQRRKRRKWFRPPLCPTCGRYPATEERGVKVSSAPGQGKQLEPTWRDKDRPPPCHADGLLQPGGMQGSILGWGGKHPQRRVSSSPAPRYHCLPAVRYLRQSGSSEGLRESLHSACIQPAFSVHSACT